MRTDPHRPGAIHPADYDLIDYFGRITFEVEPGVYDVETYGDEAVQEYHDGPRCGVYEDDLEKCDICGARYKHGAVLKHADGLISIGQNCATTYLSMKIGSHVRGPALKRVKAAKREAARRLRESTWRREGAAKAREFLRNNSDLREVIGRRHRIIDDIRAKLVRWGSISPKQIDLVFKLANEEPKIERPKAKAPEGRRAVVATVLKVKEVEGYMGGVDFKVIAEVMEPDMSVWRCYGTLPAAVGEACRGDHIRFTATFQPSDDNEDFAWFKRPAKAEFVKELSQ